MADPQKRRQQAIEQELALLHRREEGLRRAAERERPAVWQQKLEEKVPPKVRGVLQTAFSQAFALIFEKGNGVVERTCGGERIRAEGEIRRFAFRMRGDRRALRQFRWSAGALNQTNLALTAAEGVALGALGIGLPDIALFLGVLLRGIYQTALHYGIDYHSPEERIFILRLMETAMARGAAWAEGNEAMDRLIDGQPWAVGPEALEEQIRRTAGAFARELLTMKFIQGLPVVGVFGGLGNPLYYHRVLRYAQLKYARRALLALLAETREGRYPA